MKQLQKNSALRSKRLKTFCGGLTTKQAWIIAPCLLLLLCGMSTTANCASKPPKHLVSLAWVPSQSPNLKYQQLWRQSGCAGVPSLRKKIAIDIQAFVDKQVESGQTYCYYVTVTNSKKLTSDPSNIAVAQIP